VSLFTANPGTLPTGYDNTSDFPSEPAGWGQPGQVRHAENIGHGVWVAEHPDDALSSDELIARSQAARADLESAVANVRKVFGAEAQCPTATCVRIDHPTWEMCEDAIGHSWFQGEPHDATKETNR
jgi:hypothetical protein